MSIKLFSQLSDKTDSKLQISNFRSTFITGLQLHTQKALLHLITQRMLIIMTMRKMVGRCPTFTTKPTWKMVFMLKTKWTAWQDPMPACMEDKYHQAKFQMALKMISTTALEDMLTKERNPVCNPNWFHFHLIEKIIIFLYCIYSIHIISL